MPDSKKRKKSSSRKKSSLFIKKDTRVILILISLLLITIAYFLFLASNVVIKSEKYHVYIPPDTDPDELAELLKKEEIISNGISFEYASKLMALPVIKSGGLHEIKKGWNNISLILHLKNNHPKDYNILEIQPYRSRKKIIRDICGQLALDSKIFTEKLKYIDSIFHLENINKESVYCLFIPGVYKVPKNLNEENLISILHAEFLHFFNKSRTKKLDKAGLSPTDAIILSSIVYSETKIIQEMPIIAGVYLNRLNKDMRLEADPTLIFASGNFGTRRVYINNKKLPYPEYNTYKKKGLPPGPIHFPSRECIDAVLSVEDHNYLYFCAKGDSTGCHLFAETYEDHKVNAQKFRKNLDLKKIFK